MSANNAPAFNPKVVLGLLLFGALAFLAALYFIGTGQTGSGADNTGDGHAGAKGLNGYAALADLLEDDGYDVSLSRSPGALNDYNLLILTPPHFMDAEELTKVVEERRYQGPTIIVMPKWYASKIPETWDVEKEDGWVVLGGAELPTWAQDMDGFLSMDLSINKLSNAPADWQGLGLSGRLPDREQTMSALSSSINPMVKDSRGQTLVGYLDDGGYYPVLADASGIDPGDYDDLDGERWGVIIVAEPDLLNNYGMASEARAQLARIIVDTAMEGEDLPITFDLTQNGLGQAQNLLTLAFRPPFLAATLCLIIAMLVVGWRAFRRFGPPVAEGRAIAFGKQQLIANSAGLIQRTKRMHLLTGPYAEMMRARIAAALGMRRADDDQIDAALRRRFTDEPPLSQQLSKLRSAKTPHDLLRAASALRSLERKLSR